MNIAIAQVNPVIADIKGNTEKIISFIRKAKNDGAELIIFPEMTITGYPPMDLIEAKKLINDNLSALDDIKKHTKDVAVICGFIDISKMNFELFYNGAVFIENGEIKFKQYKTLLPNYDVFDEQRYFLPAEDQNIFNYKGKSIGITICEDIWKDEIERYNIDPVKNIINKGVDFIINISASPFEKNKFKDRLNLVKNISTKNKVPVVYVNQVGGNDSLVFDGGSFVVNNNGKVISMAKRFEEDIAYFNDSFDSNEISINEDLYDEIYEIENALVLGVRDYVGKCGFKKVLVGLSGGIDSALTAAIAVKALGAENVMGVTMPSHFSSKGSVDDSVKLAQNLGIEIKEIAIKKLFDQFNNDLSAVFTGLKPDVTEENIQARIRGNLLMAISNKFGAMLLTTGNKSEIAMGYCTLYGDMSGGLAVISDLPKTYVYKLSKYINRNAEIIPWDTITKPPSAELREDQKDEDSLPPYDILDGILELYIEQKKSAREIIDAGYDFETVEFVLRIVDRNEYKRRQAAPGLKVTSKAFGFGRRIPIAQRFRP